MAFKDVGARFMSRCLAYFNSDKKGAKNTVIVATSGDTGGAVASGFLGVEGVDVLILYPSGKVSDIQERQLTTLGKNITALEVDGDFDACQDMVKKAFLDNLINTNLKIVENKNDIDTYDILLLDGYYKSSHFAVYLGQDKILHQPRYSLSKIEDYSGFYKNRTDLIFRLKYDKS
jgi:threonine synthase